MNAVEKILAMHAGREKVVPGEIIDVALDFIMSNDACTSIAIDAFKNELKGEHVFDPDKLVVVLDHYTPCSSVDAADTHNRMRDFCSEQQVVNMYDTKGVCHQIMLEKHVLPGQLIIGADSHTCTYGALGALATGMGSTDIAVAWKTGRIWMRVPESIQVQVKGTFQKGVTAKDLILKVIGDLGADGATYKAIVFTGSAITSMTVSERSTLCNMGIEAGAKFAFVQADDVTDAYLEDQNRSGGQMVRDDDDAVYAEVRTVTLDNLQPQIAYPHCMDNVADVAAYEGLPIHKIFVGACTNGRYDDLELVASLLKGKKVHPNIRLFVTPASDAIFRKAIETGIMATLLEAGVIFGTPGCSACFGGSIGIVGKGERLLTTANRNFRGRVGSSDAEIYVVSPYIAALSAISGYITASERKENAYV